MSKYTEQLKIYIYAGLSIFHIHHTGHPIIHAYEQHESQPEIDGNN